MRRNEGVRFGECRVPHYYAVYDRRTDRLLGHVRKIKRLAGNRLWTSERAVGALDFKTHHTRREAAEYLMSPVAWHRQAKEDTDGQERDDD